MRRNKMSKEQRNRLRRDWIDVVFPVALLIHGLPPKEDNYENTRDWREEGAKYRLTILRWYENNYLPKYSYPRQPLKNLLHDFIDKYMAWIAQA